MQIRSLSVMHKMHRALGFKHGRLSRRFLCICTLMVGAFAFSFPAVKGSADGNLKLNTDVLVNNGTSIGGSGEFSIRGQLFSSELEEQSQKLKESQVQLAKQIQTIQFDDKSTQSLDMKPVTKNLFQNYQPQVISSAEKTDKKSEGNIYLIGTVGGVFLLSIGVLIGNRRAKSKRRKKRVGNYVSHARY